jgi:phosphatidylethanolamine-binding protein (PEBP) family uncharacterized protein
MIPEALQGRNSEASRFVGKTDPAVISRYVGPTPPDKDHDYLLRVWATAEPLEGLDQGFWLNEQFHALLKAGAGDPAWMLLTGAC